MRKMLRSYGILVLLIILLVEYGYTVVLKNNIYLVKKKDTLFKISRIFNIPVSKISSYNAIKDYSRLSVGEEIFIPIIEKTDKPKLYALPKKDIKVKSYSDKSNELKDVLKDTKLVILDINKEDYLIKVPAGLIGWVKKADLSVGNEQEINAYLNEATAVVIGKSVLVFDEPDEKSKKMTKVYGGSAYTVVYEDNKWIKIQLDKKNDGWIDIRNVKLISRTQKNTAVDPVKIVDDAMMFLGTKYKYGGISVEGVDCSGLVFSAYRMNGYKLPRNAQKQFEFCEKVNENDIKKGDIAFFGKSENEITHAGIFISDKKFIHSSSSSGVIISSIDEKYYRDNYFSAGRVPQTEDKKEENSK